MNNNGIRRLQRYGLKADGNYGKIDNLHIYYDGNRITGVLEDADAVTQPGSMDYPGKQREMAFAYNEWGALTKDESRGITDIEYDSFGNPVRMVFSNGSYTRNVYSATGIKLKTEHYTNLLIPAGVTTTEADADLIDMDAGIDAGMGIDATATAGGPYEIAGLEKIEYHGPVIYRNGKVDMVLFPGGYATMSGFGVTFHYYTRDYLGNNRAVVNGTTGAIEQTTAYYPYGAVIADLGTGNFGQPFKFIGKELISANGLNEYDFGARRQYPAVQHFTSIDPLCGNYTWLSPYLYCANNPVNLVDLDGRDIWVVNSSGRILSSHSSEEFDMISILGDNNKFKIWRGEYGSIKRQSFIPDERSDSYMYFNLEGDDASTSLFEFLAENTSVEWSKTSVASKMYKNKLATMLLN